MVLCDAFISQHLMLPGWLPGPVMASQLSVHTSVCSVGSVIVFDFPSVPNNLLCFVTGLHCINTTSARSQPFLLVSALPYRQKFASGILKFTNTA